MRFASKRELVDSIEREHRTRVDLLESIPQTRWLEAGAWGDGWSIRDLLAHLTEWTRMFREILEFTKRLSADHLLTPGHFAWTGKYPLTTYVAPNTCSHYRFTIKVLKPWLRAQSNAQ